MPSQEGDVLSDYLMRQKDNVSPIISHPYTWSKLPPEQSIRLLQLALSNSPTDDLHSTLIAIRLEQPAHPIEAVSYASGESNPSISLHVEHDNEVFTTPPWAAAVNVYRYAEPDCILWVWSLPIDQNKNEDIAAGTNHAQDLHGCHKGSYLPRRS